ncbi:hypothetical protein BDV19DRAFT_374861 [Aspergillus venezuelensis]
MKSISYHVDARIVAKGPFLLPRKIDSFGQSDQIHIIQHPTSTVSHVFGMRGQWQYHFTTVGCKVSE